MQTFNTQELFDRELEREYRQSAKRFSDTELIEIFPEALPYLKHKLAVMERQSKSLFLEILADLRKVYELKDTASITFWEQVVEILKGEELEKLRREAGRLKFLLFPPKNDGGKVTEEQIRRAKEYPFTSLIEARRNMARCLFHQPDNHPSFSIKNNFGHCFSCGWSGDTIKFLMDSQKLDFRQAIKTLTL